jgi:hypothetical protein
MIPGKYALSALGIKEALNSLNQQVILGDAPPFTLRTFKSQRAQSYSQRERAAAIERSLGLLPDWFWHKRGIPLGVFVNV